MLKTFVYLSLFFFTGIAFATDENLLTFQQQLDRLQRDVNDISKSVFKNKNDSSESNSSLSSSSISAIDMRIYDLESDIKNLNMIFEELSFDIDELKNLYSELILKIDSKNINNKNNNEDNIVKTDILEIENNNINENKSTKENNLGTLTINSEDLSDTNKANNKSVVVLDNLSPAEKFQKAFDLLRSQKFEDSKLAFQEFIASNQDNDFSGSAHYWLGEIYLLEKNYLEAALVFAEGYQKYSESVKAPDMLYKLSESFVNLNKIKDACNTLLKFSQEYPNHSLVKKSLDKKIELNCINIAE